MSPDRTDTGRPPRGPEPDIEGAEAAPSGPRRGRRPSGAGAIAVEIHGEEARSAIDRAGPPVMFGRAGSGDEVLLAGRP